MLDGAQVLLFLHHSLHAPRIAKIRGAQGRVAWREVHEVDSSLKCNHETRRVCEKVAGGRSEAKTTGQGKPEWPRPGGVLDEKCIL